MVLVLVVGLMVTSSSAIFALDLSPDSPDEVRTLVASVNGTRDGRDKLLLELPSGSFLLVWADALITGDGAIELIGMGDRVSVGEQTGRVVARFDHGAPPPTPGLRGRAKDLWQDVRFTPPAMLPSPLLNGLGVSIAATRAHPIEVKGRGAGRSQTNP